MAGNPQVRRMAKLCKQVSIESPNNPTSGEAVFCFEVPVPDVPTTGARIQVTCAGVCYKKRSSTDSSTPPPSPSMQGLRDSSLFPGYEVAGIVDALGPDVPVDCELIEGDKVVLYPYDELTCMSTGYAEYISVSDTRYLVKLPDNVPLTVAAMMPSGALWSMNAVQIVTKYMRQFVEKFGKCNILIVGTGGLALWTMRIAQHLLEDDRDKVLLTIATLKDDGIPLAQEHAKCNVVSWSEDVYESLLIERTRNTCQGHVDIVLNYGANVRSLGRSMKCLNEGGIILVGAEAKEALIAKFSQELDQRKITLEAVSMGSLDQLKCLVNLVSEGKVCPPRHSVFPVENASEVIRRLSKSQIDGRAILEFTRSYSK